MDKKKKIWIAAGILVLLAAFLTGIWSGMREKPAEGGKYVQVDVVHKDGSTAAFTYESDEEYLGKLLEEQGLIEGEEGAYGLFVTTVDGETADYSTDGSWWKLQVNGEDSQTGVDEVILQDGDTYTWVYTTE